MKSLPSFPGNRTNAVFEPAVSSCARSVTFASGTPRSGTTSRADCVSLGYRTTTTAGSEDTGIGVVTAGEVSAAQSEAETNIVAAARARDTFRCACTVSVYRTHAG